MGGGPPVINGETGLCAGNDFSPGIWCGQDVAAVQIGLIWRIVILRRDTAESAARRTGRQVTNCSDELEYEVADLVGAPFDAMVTAQSSC